MKKKFKMSMFASNETLLEAKCEYLMKQYNLMRDVAVEADQVYDEFAHVVADIEGETGFDRLKKALDKAEL